MLEHPFHFSFRCDAANEIGRWLRIGRSACARKWIELAQNNNVSPREAAGAGEKGLGSHAHCAVALLRLPGRREIETMINEHTMNRSAAKR